MLGKVVLVIVLATLLFGGVYYYEKINSDQYLINQAVTQKIAANGAVDPKSVTISVVSIKDGYARVRVTAPNEDPAHAILQKKDGKWQVIWGPGTASGPGDPILQTLPQGL